MHIPSHVEGLVTSGGSTITDKILASFEMQLSSLYSETVLSKKSKIQTVHNALSLIKIADAPQIASPVYSKSIDDPLPASTDDHELKRVPDSGPSVYRSVAVPKQQTKTLIHDWTLIKYSAFGDRKILKPTQ